MRTFRSSAYYHQWVAVSKHADKLLCLAGKSQRRIKGPAHAALCNGECYNRLLAEKPQLCTHNTTPAIIAALAYYDKPCFGANAVTNFSKKRQKIYTRKKVGEDAGG